jgi:uncharacterized membrane protein
MEWLNVKPQFFFLIVALFWGGLNVWLTPPFHVPDEPAHFYKAWHTSVGNFWPKGYENQVGDYFPQELKRLQITFDSFVIRRDLKISSHLMKQASQIQINNEDRLFISFHNTARLFPLPYLPQVLGLFTGRVLSKKPLFIFYFGRIFNLVIWIFLIYWAVKLMPLHAWTMVSLALLPMHITLAASLSPDAFTNAISFLTIALILKSGLSDRPVSPKTLLWIATVLLLTSLSKNVYVIIALLLFIVPSRLFESRRIYFYGLSMVGAITALGFVLGSYYTSRVYGLVDSDVPFYFTMSETLHEVDHMKQLGFVVENPQFYVSLLTKTIHEQLLNMIATCIGVLGWLDLWLSPAYYIFMTFGLVFVALFDTNNSVRLLIHHKVIGWIIVVMVVTLVITISYFTWTPVGKDRVDGLQGRYFIPILPLILLLFYNQSTVLKRNWIIIISTIIVLISFFVSTFACIQRYWEF